MARPWEKRADELHATEGVYCDFAAFDEWMQDAIREAWLLDWQDLETTFRVGIYGAVCDAIDNAADAAGATL